MLIGLTGKRLHGKSTCAKTLCTLLGEETQIAHAFAPGKVMVKAYYLYMGVPVDLAEALVNGEHKDTPFSQLVMPSGPDRMQDGVYVAAPLIALSDVLPGHNSRQFMEDFGKWFGTECGEPNSFTLVSELTRLRLRYPSNHILMESIVYEADTFLQQGGWIVRIERQAAGSGTGEKTDAAVDRITPHILVHNDSTHERRAYLMRVVHDVLEWAEQAVVRDYGPTANQLNRLNALTLQMESLPARFPGLVLDTATGHVNGHATPDIGTYYTIR